MIYLQINVHFYSVNKMFVLVKQGSKISANLQNNELLKYYKRKDFLNFFVLAYLHKYFNLAFMALPFRKSTTIITFTTAYHYVFDFDLDDYHGTFRLLNGVVTVVFVKKTTVNSRRNY